MFERTKGCQQVSTNWPWSSNKSELGSGFCQWQILQREPLSDEGQVVQCWKQSLFALSIFAARKTMILSTALEMNAPHYAKKIGPPDISMQMLTCPLIVSANVHAAPIWNLKDHGIWPKSTTDGTLENPPGWHWKDKDIDAECRERCQSGYLLQLLQVLESSNSKLTIANANQSPRLVVCPTRFALHSTHTVCSSLEYYCLHTVDFI